MQLKVLGFSLVLILGANALFAQPAVKTLDAALTAQAREALRKAVEQMEGEEVEATPVLEPKLNTRQIPREPQVEEEPPQQRKPLRERLFGPRSIEKEEEKVEAKSPDLEEAPAPQPSRRQVRAGIARQAPVPADPPKPEASKLPDYEPLPEPRKGELVTGNSKEERLAALLLLYKKNVITPNEYHNQRHKIISSP
jgi:hypothetical protein